MQISAADFYVDSPRVNVWQESEIEVGGWVWGGLADPVVSVKLEAASWSYLLDYGLERGDVAAYLEQPDAVPSGFHGRLELPSSIGSGQTLSIAAYRQSGERIELKRIRFKPVKLSTLWRPWLEKYPAWREDPFWFALGTSGVSARGDQGFSEAYASYRSETFRIGLRVPILYMLSLIHI